MEKPLYIRASCLFLTSVIRRNLQPVRPQERLARKSRIQRVLQTCPCQLFINLATAVVEIEVIDLEAANTALGKRTRWKEKRSTGNSQERPKLQRVPPITKKYPNTPRPRPLKVHLQRRYARPQMRKHVIRPVRRSIVLHERQQHRIKRIPRRRRRLRLRRQYTQPTPLRLPSPRLQRTRALAVRDGSPAIPMRRARPAPAAEAEAELSVQRRRGPCVEEDAVGFADLVEQVRRDAGCFLGEAGRFEGAGQREDLEVVLSVALREDEVT
jgi:hypothetical protein